MDGATVSPSSRGHGWWVKALAGLAVAAVLLVLLAIFFPWDVLRGPLNRYVSDKTGRHFEITRHLDVKLGRTTRIVADGIEFANPEWARDPLLVKAEGAEIDIELLPLLRRRIVLPLIEFHQPQLGLQMEPDGRRSWALGRDTKDPGNLPDIGAIVVDRGTVHFVATEHGADSRRLRDRRPGRDAGCGERRRAAGGAAPDFLGEGHVAERAFRGQGAHRQRAVPAGAGGPALSHGHRGHRSAHLPAGQRHHQEPGHARRRGCALQDGGP
jgi:hypothetical protein